MADALVHLAEHHIISLLAVRLLDASLDTGRNLLFTGPMPGCLPLMTALVAEGEQPGIFSAQLHGSERQTPSGEGAGNTHADRFAAWQQSPKDVATALLHHVGVVAHLPASRLDRCLMRLELALASTSPGPSQALAVLAAVDLVVVMAADSAGVTRVRGIYELIMSAEGYRPAALFLAGQEPAPEALVPMRQPSFVLQLQEAGHPSLAAELAAAEPAMPTAPPAAAPPVQASPEGATAPSLRREPPKPATARPASARVPAWEAAKRPASAPGWELDQAGALEPVDGFAQEALQEPPTAFAEVLAAQDDLEDGPMALEPPPRPHGENR